MKKLFFAIMLTSAIFFVGVTATGQANTTAAYQSGDKGVQAALLNEKGDSVLTRLDLQLNKIDSMVKSQTNNIIDEVLNKVANRIEYKNTTDAKVEIIVSVVFFVVCLVIACLAIWFYYKNRQNRYKLMMKALEMGQSIPILEEVKPKRNKNSFYYLKNGLIIGGIGLAFIILGLLKAIDTDRLSDYDEFFLIGFILTGLAAAFIIIGCMKKKEEQQPQQKQQ